MNIQDFAPVSSDRIGRIHWAGERAYRVLSQSFSVRWSGDLTGDQAHYVFGSFTVTPQKSGASGNGSVVYSLVDLGPRDPRRYRLLLEDEQLISSPNADDVEHHLLFQILTRVQKLSDEYLLIHAGSVVSPEGHGILLPANPGDGKTTLVAGLIKAGFGFLSDEVGVIDPRTGVLHAHQRALNFKEGGLAIFADFPLPAASSRPAGGYQYLRAEEIRNDVLADPSELRLVVAPQYRQGSHTHVTQLTRAATVKELWIHAMNLSPQKAKALPILVDVARRAEGYRLVSGDLSEAVGAVKAITSRL